MNNEPVAWMGKDYDGIKTDFYFDVEKNKLPYRLYETAIPLYTHPSKDLTDEEIEQCFADSCTDFKLLENGKTKGVVNVIDVGRAILRKAQEQ